MVYVLRPTRLEDVIKNAKSPIQTLRQRLQHVTLDKHLYSMALDAYFRHTRLTIVITDQNFATEYHIPDSVIIASPSFTPMIMEDYDEPKLLFGDSDEHPIYFEPAKKLRLQLLKPDWFSKCKLFHTIKSCRRLTELTICVANHPKKYAVEVWTEAQKIVGIIDRDRE